MEEEEEEEEVMKFPILHWRISTITSTQVSLCQKYMVPSKG